MVTPYLTVLEADAILDQLMEVHQWAGFSTEEKTRALNSATVAFNNLAYSGDKTSDTQVNEFPRNGDTTPPEDFLMAVAIEGYTLLDGKQSEAEWSTQFMISQDFSGVSSRYDRGTKEPNIMCGIMSINAYRLVKKYLADYQELILENN